MKELNFRVDGTRLTTKSGERVTTGNIEFVRCNFQFDASWDGMVKTAVFYQPRTLDQAIYMVLDAQDGCVMPLLKQEAELYVGVFGILGDARAATNFCVFSVIPGSYIEGMGPAEPSRDVYEQLLQQVAESLQGTRENAAAAARSAANAKSGADTAAAKADDAMDQADRAKVEADRAKVEADRAAEIAGGDVVTKAELTGALASKIDTVPAAPAGNVPVFDGNGQIMDSGRSAASIGDGNVKSINSQTPDDAGNVAVNTLAVGDTEPTDPNVVEWIDTGADAEIKSLEEIGAVVRVANPVAGNVAVLTDKGGIADGGAALSGIVDGLQAVTVQLGNKAINSYGTLTCTDLLSWAKQQTHSGAFVINPDTTTVGPPAKVWYSGWLEASVSSNARRMTITQIAGTPNTFINITSSGKWRNWTQLAAATPPREYDLPLAEGIADGAGGGASKYWKDQFGLVGFTIAVSGTMTDGVVMALLPAGYRPSHLCLYPISNGGTLSINESGNVVIYGKSGDTVIYSAGSFVSAP